MKMCVLHYIVSSRYPCKSANDSESHGRYSRFCEFA